MKGQEIIVFNYEDFYEENYKYKVMLISVWLAN